MLALARPEPSKSDMASDMTSDLEPHGPPIALPTSIVRYGYAPPRGQRVIAFFGTALVYAIAAVALFISFQDRPASPKPPSAPLVVTLLPLASPPEAPPKPKDAPKPVEKHEREPLRSQPEPVMHPIVPLPTIAVPPPSPAVERADPTPPQPETAAPKTAPAPQGSRASSNTADTWEGRVLSRLEKFRKYPGSARSARQQGVVYIRFRISREGHVLSSSLVRSSGFPALDQAALETLRRADPLPRIPADRPEQIELSVPVEFTIH